MKFYTFLCLLLAKYANAQDDNPSGHEVGQRPIVGVPNVPDVPGVPNFDDNPSPSDLSSSTTLSTRSTPTPTTTSRPLDENSGETNKWMLIWSMMLML
jgi:hypothetical protein